MNIAIYRLQVWVAQRRKAVVALVVPVVVTLAARHGLDLTEAQIMALVALLTPAAVYNIPNQQEG
jgi:uncharacterized membrane protein (DUF441 family)